MVYRICLLIHGVYVNTRFVYDSFADAYFCSLRMKNMGMKDATIVCHKKNDPKWEAFEVSPCVD